MEQAQAAVGVVISAKPGSGLALLGKAHSQPSAAAGEPAALMPVQSVNVFVEVVLLLVDRPGVPLITELPSWPTFPVVAVVPDVDA